MALIAAADARERMRCVRSIAAQTTVSALAAASWDEVLQAVDGVKPVALIVYVPPLPGEPADAIAELKAMTLRLVAATDGGVALSEESGVRWVPKPISEETLILLARGIRSHSAAHRVSFAPVDYLQMICMTGDSHTLIVSRDGADVGIIEVREGKVWTAFDAMGVGEDAFARLVRPEMRARVRTAVSAAKERTLHKDVTELALDAFRRIDEGLVPLPLPLSSTQMEDALASPAQIAAKIKELGDQVERLVASGDEDEAARVLARLSQLDPASSIVAAHGDRLRASGHLR